MSGGSEKPTRPIQATLRLEETDGAELRSKLAASLRGPSRPCLVVLSGAEIGTRVRVDGSGLIGRDPTALLRLSDPLVSWHHARLEDRGDGWALLDHGSTNGTSVNGARVREALLRPSDKIELGSTIVRFEVQDPTEQAYDAAVERLLNIDDLSGLYQRRRFDLELAALVEEATLRGAPLGFLAMDLDGVKRINDAHGHLFGAYVIGEAGHVLGRTLGARGIAARFGGDEFVAALPGADLARASACGEELRRAIAEHVFERDGIRLRPGISVGAASVPESARDAQSLFQRADEALYRAKAAGKNCVRT